MAALTLAWVSGSPSQLHIQNGGQLDNGLTIGFDETTAARTNLPEFSTTIGPPESPVHAKPSSLLYLWIKILLDKTLKKLIENDKNQAKRMV